MGISFKDSRDVSGPTEVSIPTLKPSARAVSAGWRLAVDADALHFLLAARVRDRVLVLDGLDKLVQSPDQPCDFTERSPNQRNYSVKVVGSFMITY